MKRAGIILTIVLSLFTSFIYAQGKFYTKTGKISFFSATPLENINAVNKSAVCLLDSKTGDLQFAVLLKGFEFKKALMQEDFNRDYVESNKFPKSEFKGQVTNNSSVNYSVNGTYNAEVKGKLSMHGRTKDITANGTVTVKDGKIILNAVFNILLADFDIRVPKMYLDNIAKSIKTTVECTLDPIK
jgi:hypothetical protein